MISYSGLLFWATLYIMCSHKLSLQKLLTAEQRRHACRRYSVKRNMKPFNRGTVSHQTNMTKYSHSIWMRSVTRTIFSVFAFKIIHRVTLLTRFCTLLTTVEIMLGGGTCLKYLNGTTPLMLRERGRCSFSKELLVGMYEETTALVGWLSWCRYVSVKTRRLKIRKPM